MDGHHLFLVWVLGSGGSGGEQKDACWEWEGEKFSDLMVFHLSFHSVFLCRRGELGPLRDSRAGVWVRSGFCSGKLDLTILKL